MSSTKRYQGRLWPVRQIKRHDCMEEDSAVDVGSRTLCRNCERSYCPGLIFCVQGGVVGRVVRRPEGSWCLTEFKMIRSHPCAGGDHCHRVPCVFGTMPRSVVCPGAPCDANLSWAATGRCDEPDVTARCSARQLIGASLWSQGVCRDAPRLGFGRYEEG